MHLTEEFIEQILRETAEMDFPAFFVTAEVIRASSEYPHHYKEFLQKKYRAITQNGISGRIFSFRDKDWLIRITFFPTDRVVEEKYALKNRIIPNRK